MIDSTALSDAAVRMLQCPRTKSALSWAATNELASANGQTRYTVRDGIVLFGSEGDGPGVQNEAKSVQRYYEQEGWTTDARGVFADTRAFVDLRAHCLSYTHRCMLRLAKYFRGGGEYLLDLGSGPIPHQAYLTYGNGFAKRVCIDLSIPALRIAQSKLGDKGVYLRGDVTNLPIRSGTIDAVTCNHVMYHIPADKQEAAFREIWRVLKPGGIGVVVYAWDRSPILRVLEKSASLMSRAKPDPLAKQPELYYHAHALNWFRSQNWPFRYRIDTFRIVDERFMKRYVGDGQLSRMALQLLYATQLLLPGFCGKYGAFPAIVIYKD